MSAAMGVADTGKPEVNRFLNDAGPGRHAADKAAKADFENTVQIRGEVRHAVAIEVTDDRAP